MKIKLFSIIFALFILSNCLSGCSRSANNAERPSQTVGTNANAKKFVLTKRQFVRSNTLITYPSLKLFGDSNYELINKINENISKDALAVVLTNAKLKNIKIDVQYKIEKFDNKVLSIKYIGKVTKYTSLIQNVFYTTNINLLTGERITLNDLVETNSKLIDVLNKAKKVSKSGVDFKKVQAKYGQSELLNILKNSDSGMVLDKKKKDFSMSVGNCYLIKDSIIVCFNSVFDSKGNVAQFIINSDSLIQQKLLKKSF